MIVYLSYNQCPTHKTFASISLDDDSGGLRLTASKCCGRWDRVRAFKMSTGDLRRMAGEALRLAERLETGDPQ